MRSRPLSTPVLLVGGAMMLIGLILVGPSLVVSLRYRPSTAILLEAFPHQLEDGRVRLAVLYEYEIRPGDLPGWEGPASALAYTRGDRFGRPVGDLVLSDAEALGFLARIRDKDPLRAPAYYHPDNPLDTVIAQYADAGSLALSLPHLGLLLLLTPPLTWTILILLRGIGRTAGPRPRS